MIISFEPEEFITDEKGAWHCKNCKGLLSIYSQEFYFSGDSTARLICKKCYPEKFIEVKKENI